MQTPPTAPGWRWRPWMLAPGVATAAGWVALFWKQPALLETFTVVFPHPLVPAIGFGALGTTALLYRAHRARFTAIDKVLLGLAAAPALLTAIEGAASLANRGARPLLANAGWGLLLMFPAVMLIGTSLVRRRILPGWNQVVSLGGFVLPLIMVLRNGFDLPGAARGLALGFGVTWVVLAAATVSAGPGGGKPPSNRT